VCEKRLNEAAEEHAEVHGYKSKPRDAVSGSRVRVVLGGGAGRLSQIYFCTSPAPQKRIFHQRAQTFTIFKW